MSQHIARVDVSLDKWSGAAPGTASAAELANDLPDGVLLAPAPYAGEYDREPDTTWTLTGLWDHQGETAAGTAGIYYSGSRRSLVKPFIFADGFNYGPSDLPGLFGHFNTPYGTDRKQFLDQLLTAGYDVVLLGFDERHTHIQANAGVAASCIVRITSELGSRESLTVGGVSMGGMITRYALARLEQEGVDHRTATYLSWDTPHNGAWIPLILQQLAYFFESLSSLIPGGGPTQADLIKSPAAQQLLWAWVPDARTSGPVATASDLRAEFLGELDALQQWPARPLKLGVANSPGNGRGNGVEPDQLVFDWNLLSILQANVRTQPDLGEGRYVGRMYGNSQWRTTTTSHVPGLDGAPGGTLASYGLLADALKIKIDDSLRSCCFVPTVSAVAVEYDPVTWNVDLRLDVDAAGDAGVTFGLDQFHCDTENSEHGTVTAELADWVLNQLI
ncbi:alpha/beta hydrolase [Streptacidiphilus sp. 4-A2]|nr:alpha/beta hydrolase [Streptacidiphilus sp. 4-A2]